MEGSLMQTYTVQQGDSLFNIAKKFYGDGYKYKLLALYNHIDNPDTLEVGQTLKIPPLEDLETTRSLLSEWHNYSDGTIYWRVTAKGVEIKGKGLIMEKKYSQRAAKIWEKYQQAILAASQKHDVPIPAIIATISTESSGNPNAYRYEPAFYDRYIKDKSRWKNNPFYKFPKRISASYGLMQIMYTTAYSVGFRGKPEDLYDPATNIEVGAAYIASPFQRKNHGWDPPKIACAYNAGSVRSTKKNAWGMFYHPGHLDRWIPSYNGAIETIGVENVPQSPELVEPEEQQPQAIETPVVPEEPGERHSTLRFLFPKEGETAWKPVIVDVFKHAEGGISDPVSYTIESPALDPNTGYTYEIPDVETGVYDFVFTDAVSQSVIEDISNYVVDQTLEIIDLRSKRKRAISDGQEATSSIGIGALLKNFFQKILSQIWK